MTLPTIANGPVVLFAPDIVDPRTMLDERALVAASHNGFPVVARRTARKDGAGLIAGASVALLLGGLTFWSMSAHRGSPAAVPPAVAVQPLSVPASPAVASAGPTRLASRFPIESPLPPAPSIERGAAPVLVYDAGAASAAPVASSPEAGTAAGWSTSPIKPSTIPGGNDNDQFAARIGGSSADVASAQPLDSPSTTVIEGTLIAAVLETAIDTDLPGYVRAVVSRDVRSFDGNHVLIPRSSRLIGQYKSGLAAGQTRAYIVWSRLIRPDGASVALASPGVDYSGSSGLDGKVDGHFLKRFGAAALLTVIGGVSEIGNPAVVVSGGQGAAGIAAQGNTQIPPTIRIAQGQPIRVFTARDLDFAAVSAGTVQP